MKKSPSRFKALDWAQAEARKQLEMLVDTASANMGSEFVWAIGNTTKSEGKLVVRIVVNSVKCGDSFTYLIPLIYDYASMSSAIRDMSVFIRAKVANRKSRA